MAVTCMADYTVKLYNKYLHTHYISGSQSLEATHIFKKSIFVKFRDQRYV